MTEQVFRFPLEHVPLEQFCRMTGYTPEAIRTKIHRAEWAEGDQYRKDPSGRIQIILAGYDRWVRSGAASKHAAAA